MTGACRALADTPFAGPAGVQIRICQEKQAASAAKGMVQLGGLEPPTFGATIRRSNQLSYNCTSGRVIRGAGVM